MNRRAFIATAIGGLGAVCAAALGLKSAAAPRYKVGIDPGAPSGDVSTTTVMERLPDGKMRVVMMKARQCGYSATQERMIKEWNERRVAMLQQDAYREVIRAKRAQKP